MLLPRLIPLSALITPATLGVTSQPRSTIHSLLVNQPSLSENPDFYLDSTFTEPSAPLMKHFAGIITTGEVLPPPIPQDLQNISYSLDVTVPIVRCLPSNNDVINWTAAAAVETAIYNGASKYGNAFPLNTENTIIETNTRNLTWTMNSTLSGQIGYFGMHGNTSMTTSNLADFWIVILENNSSSYFTCGIWKASVPTNVTFVNNVLNLQTGSTRILDFEQDDRWSMLAYQYFGDTFFNFLVDCVANFEVAPDAWAGLKNRTLDPTVFGTALDYFNVSFVWNAAGSLPQGIVPQGIVPQSKKLITLIEDVALNASLSLMSNSFAWKVLDLLLKYCN
jgi:hypothetical protein